MEAPVTTATFPANLPMYELSRVWSQSASQHPFGAKRKKQRSGTRAMSIDRHSVDTPTQAAGKLEMNDSIAAESTLAEDDVCDHGETDVRRDHHRHRPAGPPLAKQLSEAVSELIPTMLEEIGSSAA
jgi:hypothetical protein